MSAIVAVRVDTFLVTHRYRLGELVLSRGIARTYRAVDEILEDEVMVEHVPPVGVPGDDEARLDYVAEYRAVAVKVMRLRHPNVIPIRDFGFDDEGGHFIVKQYDRGHSLDVHRPSLTGGDRVELAKGILRGLAALHHANLIHRDVKPYGIYVRDDETPTAQVDHFHLTVSAELAYLDSQLCGTLLYLAPEIASATGARVYTKGVDVYAAGLVCLELLSERSVLAHMQDAGFDGGHDALLDWITDHGGHVSAAAIRAAIAGPLAELVVCATQPDPRDRFPDAKAFYESLALNAPIRIARHDDPASPDALSNLLARLPDSELCGALVAAFRIMNVDARMAVAKCRQITEVVAQQRYRQHLGEPRSKPLVNLVDELQQAGGIPLDLASHFVLVRREGNRSVHGDTPVTVDGVLQVIAATIRIVTWHLS